ncbi:ABC transporter substrate-binding protein [Paracoccus sp. p4-l81]|uniref:ABC transporter substrate-binding protein n=1 Tax=Paracoccus sp. p4-l81 TaxID=3342806 RepID=UPI0035BA93D5
MKKLLLASVAALVAGAASAEEIKMGVSLGFTGPLESMAPHMAGGAELAYKEVSESGKLLGGTTVVAVRSDSTCTDAAAATAGVEKLITTEGVKGIVGGMCSGEATASLQNVAMPNGVVMISPSATSPALSNLEDGGLFFRTAPSDARQGEVLADLLIAKDIKEVAVTFTNNDYGKGLADSFAAAFAAKGGKVTVSAPHDDGKADYSAEVGALAAGGGQALVVAGYADQGGAGILRGSIDQGAFDKFVLPDGMVGSGLEEKFGKELDGSIGINPASDGPGRAKFEEMAKAAGFDPNSPYSGEAYDAGALMLLAMQAANSSDPKVWKDKVMNVANAPGEKILPGELGKGLELLAAGTDIDYDGASSVEFVGNGESAGSFRETEVKDGKFTTVTFH